MATTIRDYPKLAADICDAVGKDNIISAAHCATRLRLVQRVGGTLIGLVLGWALISLFPDPLLQSLFAVAAGVVFFTTRTSRYLLCKDTRCLRDIPHTAITNRNC